MHKVTFFGTKRELMVTDLEAALIGRAMKSKSHVSLPRIRAEINSSSIASCLQEEPEFFLLDRNGKPGKIFDHNGRDFVTFSSGTFSTEALVDELTIGKTVFTRDDIIRAEEAGIGIRQASDLRRVELAKLYEELENNSLKNLLDQPKAE